MAGDLSFLSDKRDSNVLHVTLFLVDSPPFVPRTVITLPIKGGEDEMAGARRLMAQYDLDKDGMLKKRDFKNLANMVISHYRMRSVSSLTLPFLPLPTTYSPRPSLPLTALSVSFHSFISSDHSNRRQKSSVRIPCNASSVKEPLVLFASASIKRQSNVMPSRS